MKRLVAGVLALCAVWLSGCSSTKWQDDSAGCWTGRSIAVICSRAGAKTGAETVEQVFAAGLRDRDYEVVRRTDVERALYELGLDRAKLSPDDVIGLGEQLEADGVMVVSVDRDEDPLSVTAQLTCVELCTEVGRGAGATTWFYRDAVMPMRHGAYYWVWKPVAYLLSDFTSFPEPPRKAPAEEVQIRRIADRICDQIPGCQATADGDG